MSHKSEMAGPLNRGDTIINKHFTLLLHYIQNGLIQLMRTRTRPELSLGLNELINLQNMEANTCIQALILLYKKHKISKIWNSPLNFKYGKNLKM